MQDGRKKILAVDDDLMILEVLHIVLEELGYDVETLHEPRKALDAIRAYKPDLVILDVVMPEMDGTVVLQQMKGKSTLCTIPTILISASHEGERLARECGATAFVQKPFDISDIEKVVNNTLVSVS